MKSLYARIFLSFWLAMTIVGAASAVIYASSMPEWRLERVRHLVGDAVRLRGIEAHAAFERGGPAAATAVLAGLEQDTRIRAFLFENGTLTAGGLATPEVLEVAAEVTRTQASVRRSTDELHLIGEPLAPGAVVVGTDVRTSLYLKYLAPTTLPLRLLIVTLVAGVVCYLLARHLTRRLRLLRDATQRIAQGDLSVRVAPHLAHMEDEAAALGRDIDGLTERIETLLAGQHRLLRDVSHELRSPLARLNVALALARQKAGVEAAIPLDRIEREVERLAQLIGEVLTLTRLEEADRPAPSARVDLTAMVADVVRDADYEAQGHGRHVALIEATPVQLIGSEELLRRAVENVVRNATRFTAEGTTVEVLVSKRESSTLIEVRDFGRGVPEADLTEIFRPFHRVGDARDRGSGGTGIGLAITARAVRLHGGTVVAANAEGGGLRVTLTLPATPPF